MSISPHDVARESYLHWRNSGFSHEDACALLSMEDGETSFRWASRTNLGFFGCVVGDHGKAHGPFQHWDGRANAIQEATKIDVRTCSHLDALKGADWEMSHGDGYRRVRQHLQEAATPRDKVSVLVREYERSRMQDRDIERRLHLFDYWNKEFRGINESLPFPSA
jgi:hypothetical protein